MTLGVVRLQIRRQLILHEIPAQRQGDQDLRPDIALPRHLDPAGKGADPLAEGKLYTFPNFPGGGWSVELASELYVDLGLTSGLKWAKCNVGAEAETDYGDHFTWGETATKSNYAWSTYFDNPGGDGTTFTKYALDKKTQLDLEDDAAYAALGGKFRMPTDAEWKELIDECNLTWKTTEAGYASNGYLVTGPNEKTIYLPFAGYWDGTVYSNAGSYVYYWSSSLNESQSDYAWSWSFYSAGKVKFGIPRFAGASVRPVSD